MPQISKGERDQATVRMPVSLGKRVRANAAERRLSVSDYVASVLAEHVGLPELAPLPPAKRDQELPMTG